MTLLTSIIIMFAGYALGACWKAVGLRPPQAKEPPGRPSVASPPSASPHGGPPDRKRRQEGTRIRIFRGFPAAELATALLFLWMYARFGLTGEALVGAALVSLAVIVTVTDLRFRRIPNKVLLAFLPILLMLRLIFPLGSVWTHLLGAFLGFGTLMMIAWLTRGIGMGDVKLFTLLGWVVGFPYVIVAFVLAFVLGSLTGGILWAAGLLSGPKSIAFAPWLAAGTLAAFGYGAQMVQGYVTYSH
ncbi:prepilin peptidase [Paenibacillus sp. A14]|uniref:prepilin peptidase n=1 Tax=Paenibacillus sp. A14 TaxID=3119820 RepID=UPI002FE08FBB